MSCFLQTYCVLQADALFGMWTAALAQGSAGTSAAFHAALQLLSSQQPTQNTLASKPASPLASPPLLQCFWRGTYATKGSAYVHEGVLEAKQSRPIRAHHLVV